jgi:hypothetical protein
MFAAAAASISLAHGETCGIDTSSRHCGQVTMPMSWTLTSGSAAIPQRTVPLPVS